MFLIKWTLTDDFLLPLHMTEYRRALQSTPSKWHSNYYLFWKVFSQSFLVFKLCGCKNCHLDQVLCRNSGLAYEFLSLLCWPWIKHEILIPYSEAAFNITLENHCIFLFVYQHYIKANRWNLKINLPNNSHTKVTSSQ